MLSLKLILEVTDSIYDCTTGIICYPVDGETEIEPNCDLYKPIPKIGLACNRMLKPVCGTNGQTYTNECELCSDKLKLKSKIKIKHKNSCVKDDCQEYGTVCTMESNPVCGSDSVTYDNKCSFCNAKTRNADLLIVSDGECKPKDECEGYKELCTFIYSPVCGSDAVSYSSMCIFCGAKRQ
ncbi:double-headed protease inhibitor, submandibular gland-like [Bufo bufo]|uniref:double-headed protease inhibitor, submandibular gland-like n=1 Tax=Bufo bufo TaxID=8384 RepID=UPI001ABDB069|nr:double-headed protease inhibitor, submandibular gland-like [Bufo bufo]